MALLNSAVHALIRDFGAGAQAGSGIAGRVMQALALPSMAISFAIPPWPARTSARAIGGAWPTR